MRPPFEGSKLSGALAGISPIDTAQINIDEFSYKWNHRKTENVFELTLSRGLGV